MYALQVQYFTARATHPITYQHTRIQKKRTKYAPLQFGGVLFIAAVIR